MTEQSYTLYEIYTVKIIFHMLVSSFSESDTLVLQEQKHDIHNFIYIILRRYFVSSALVASLTKCIQMQGLIVASYLDFPLMMEWQQA